MPRERLSTNDTGNGSKQLVRMTYESTYKESLSETDQLLELISISLDGKLKRLDGNNRSTYTLATVNSHASTQLEGYAPVGVGGGMLKVYMMSKVCSSPMPIETVRGGQ